MLWELEKQKGEKTSLSFSFPLFIQIYDLNDFLVRRLKIHKNKFFLSKL